MRQRRGTPDGTPAVDDPVRARTLARDRGQVRVHGDRQAAASRRGCGLRRSERRGAASVRDRVRVSGRCRAERALHQGAGLLADGIEAVGTRDGPRGRDR